MVTLGTIWKTLQSFAETRFVWWAKGKKKQPRDCILSVRWRRDRYSINEKHAVLRAQRDMVHSAVVLIFILPICLKARLFCVCIYYTLLLGSKATHIIWLANLSYHGFILHLYELPCVISFIFHKAEYNVRDRCLLFSQIEFKNIVRLHKR